MLQLRTTGAVRPTCSPPLSRRLYVRVSASTSGSNDAEGLGQQSQYHQQAKSSSDSQQMMQNLDAVAKMTGSDRGSKLVLANGDNDTWRLLDKKVNKYPGQRVFTAIGTGGDDFRHSMVRAVERVVGSVHLECISERSRGAYISVRVGPVWVENPDQVLTIFDNMRADERLKWFI